MSGIGDIVTVTITSNTRTPTRQGFGTPALMSYHTRFVERRRRYSDLDEMTDDGFVPRDAAYKMAQAAFSQNPRPEEVLVGRLPAAHTHTQTLTILSATEGEHIRFKVIPPGTDTPTQIDYTILAAATTTTVATAVELLVEAITGVDSSSAAAVITVTPTTPGGLVYIYDLENVAIKDTTADAGYDDELTALSLVDDDFYFIALDVNSEANGDLVAAWAETRTKEFIQQTQDTGEKEGTGTIGTGLQALSYDRTGLLFVEAIHEYGACAWIGTVAPKDAGSVTFKFRNLVGVTPSRLTSTQETNLKNAGTNFYSVVGGLGITQEGTAASGEFLDITHGTDWLVARIQERVFGILANADKVPYEDPSVDSILGEILSVMESAVGPPRNFLRAGTLSASAPKVADVDPADRAARLLPDVQFGAQYAGAIHKARLRGTLTV